MVETLSSGDSNKNIDKADTISEESHVESEEIVKYTNILLNRKISDDAGLFILTTLFTLMVENF